MQKIKRSAAAFFLLATWLTGCATTSGLAPSVTQSGFDGARVVTIAGHGNACTSMRCSGLGAQWHSTSPDSALLIVYLFNDIKGITGAQLNIDGTKVTLMATQHPTDFNIPGATIKESRKAFTVPLSVIRQVAASQRTWLRVQTTSGYVEDAVVDGAIDSKALHAMKRFLISVDQG